MAALKLQISPVSIMAYYIINTLAKMTNPGDKSSWPLYKSHLPDGANVKTNVGAVYDTTGTKDMRSMNGNVPQHPGIQLRVRASNYDTAYAKIEDIGAALDKVVNASVTVNGSVFKIQNVSRTSPITSLGLEPGTKRRFSFTLNFLLTMRRLS